MENKAKFDLSFLYFLLICLLSFVVLTESVIILKSSSKKSVTPGTSNPVVVTVAPEVTSASSMSVVLKDKIVTVGKSAKAAIVFDAEEMIDGVDAILSFDPESVKIGAVTANKDIFNQVLVNRQQETQGRIKITAYMPKGDVLGTQTLVSFDVKLTQNEPSLLTLEFNKVGDLKDTNLISKTTKNDLLGSVFSLNLVATVPTKVVQPNK